MGRRRRRRRDHVKFKLIFSLPESVSSRRLSSNPPRLARGLLLGLALERRSSEYTCDVVALAVRALDL